MFKSDAGVVGRVGRGWLGRSQGFGLEAVARHEEANWRAAPHLLRHTCSGQERQSVAALPALGSRPPCLPTRQSLSHHPDPTADCAACCTCCAPCCAADEMAAGQAQGGSPAKSQEANEEEEEDMDPALVRQKVRGLGSGREEAGEEECGRAGGRKAWVLWAGAFGGLHAGGCPEMPSREGGGGVGRVEEDVLAQQRAEGLRDRG